MIDQEEKKRQRKAWLTSVSIQVVLLLLFYFLIAWKEPFPPNPEFGIELNFGQVNTGSGTTPVQSPDVSEVDEVEQTASQADEQSPIEADDANEPVDPVETVDNPDPIVSQKETTSSSQKPTESDKETDDLDEQTTNPASTYQNPDTNASQGDNGDTGDQGNPEGDINKEALYGEPGGGENGSSLQMSGWEWDSPPEPNDTSQESGKIVFRIRVDQDGYLEGIEVEKSTVSLQVLNEYKRAVELLTFSKTSSYQSAPYSTGKITFIIRSR